MALTLAQAREYLNAVGSRLGNDLRTLLGALVEGDFDGESALVSRRNRSEFADDFLAAAIDAKFSSTAGSGTGNAALTTVAGAKNGQATLKSASNDGTNAANFSMTTLDQLNYKASNGGLVVEMYCAIDDVSEAYFAMGFTDTISTTVEGPFFMAAGDIDSDATDACGIMYDVDATSKFFTVGGVKNNTDTTPAIGTVAPTDNTFFRVRVEVDTAGTVKGYLNGNLVGTVANAVTTSVALTPFFVIGNRSANQVTLTVDDFVVQQAR